MFFEMTYQVRVTDIVEGHKWYKTLLKKTPDFMPHVGFMEWELIPGCWLQVAQGVPSVGSGPLRLGVKDLETEKYRLIRKLNVEDFEIFSRQEVPAKWGTFSDPWGNRIGLFEYIDKTEENQRIETILGRIEN
ncbi:ornithine monooxygenase [Bacillus sp. M6-12]|uniref:VOC family protein n=1 Tax=Bacillus sp. M6-12 TaxID=2054166 RepID=UPI000C768CF2|nr:ornithine monooxygenase [Bacillus sp. M6-12]PLS18032.1 ornithine monooxygenase [Bacillus sp. M6-12]